MIVVRGCCGIGVESAAGGREEEITGGVGRRDNAAHPDAAHAAIRSVIEDCYLLQGCAL